MLGTHLFELHARVSSFVPFTDGRCLVRNRKSCILEHLLNQANEDDAAVLEKRAQTYYVLLISAPLEQRPLDKKFSDLSHPDISTLYESRC